MKSPQIVIRVVSHSWVIQLPSQSIADGSFPFHEEESFGNIERRVHPSFQGLRLTDNRSLRGPVGGESVPFIGTVLGLVDIHLFNLPYKIKFLKPHRVSLCFSLYVTPESLLNFIFGPWVNETKQLILRKKVLRCVSILSVVPSMVPTDLGQEVRQKTQRNHRQNDSSTDTSEH